MAAKMLRTYHDITYTVEMVNPVKKEFDTIMVTFGDYEVASKKSLLSMIAKSVPEGWKVVDYTKSQEVDVLVEFDAAAIRQYGKELKRETITK